MLRQGVHIGWTMLRQVVHLVGWTVKVVLKWSVKNKTTPMGGVMFVRMGSSSGQEGEAGGDDDDADADADDDDDDCDRAASASCEPKHTPT